MGNNNNFNWSFNELVFENRNKKYGAYILRRNYDSTLLTAFFLCLAFLVLSLTIPSIIIQATSSLVPLPEKIYEDPTIFTNVTIEKPAQKQITTPPAPPASKPISTDNATPVIIEKPVVSPPVASIDTDLPAQSIPGTGSTSPNVPINPSVSTGGYTAPAVTPPPFAEVMPSFPGGIEKLYEYLGKHIRYPEEAKIHGIQGKIIISFVIGADGFPRDIKILKGIGGGCDEEITRVILGMPKWSPGRNNGTAVSVSHTMPVSFALQ